MFSFCLKADALMSVTVYVLWVAGFVTQEGMVTKPAVDVLPVTETVLSVRIVNVNVGYSFAENVTAANAERVRVRKNRVMRLNLFIIVKFTLLVWGGNVCVA